MIAMVMIMMMMIMMMMMMIIMMRMGMTLMATMMTDMESLAREGIGGWLQTVGTDLCGKKLS